MWWRRSRRGSYSRPHHDRKPREPDAERVDREVPRRAVAALDEVLVDLVARRVPERDGDRRRRVAVSERPPPQKPQQPELHHVRDLAQHGVPRAQAGVEVRLRGEEEDDRHQGDWRPEATEGSHTIAKGRMLSITTKSPYAVKALTELARQGASGPVPIGEL